VAKKLKKKQRPMTIREWQQTSGPAAAILPFMDADHPGIDKIHEVGPSLHDKALLEVVDAIFDGYHNYICAHIAHLLEKP
jgi:hypothetical protein